MKLLKGFILAVLLVSMCAETFSQDFYFTYNSPSSITIPFGASSVNATYTFTYYYPQGITLIRPKLSIQLDGTTIAGAICEGNDTYLPSSYTFNLTAGTHSIQLTLSDLGQQSNNCSQATIWQVVNISVTPKFTVRNENIFTTGSIYVDNYSVSKNSPYDRPSSATNNFAIGAIDQNAMGYNWIWNNSGMNNSDWRKQPQNQNSTNYSFSRNTSYTVQSNDNSTKLIAGLRKICNVNFQNSFVGVGNGGVININSTQYNSPTANFNVVELNPITATAVWQNINGIDYTFNKWSDGNTSATRTFNPTAHTTTPYTAQFIGKPSTINRNLHSNTTVGQPVTLYWNDNQNTNVTKAQIWRTVRHNGVTGSTQLLATVNRGTTSYVDYDYSITSGYTNDLLRYDVRYYYLTENTYSDPNYTLVVYGTVLPKAADSTMATTIHFENSISNYPNPFNPSTLINFSIKEAGSVNVRIFNLIGQEVAELVNEEKPAGNYYVAFNASNLPTGVYIYTIKSGNYFQSRKMLLVK